MLFAPALAANSQSQGLQQVSETNQLTAADQVFRGDFEQIKQRGKLRIVVPANVGGGRYLPRKGSPVSQQFEIAEAFARFHDLVPELVISESFADMIPLLVEGKGDIVVGNLTVTDSRRKKIAFSIPLDHVREKVLVASDNDTINAVKDLDHKRVMVSPSSTFWEALSWLKQHKYKNINLIERPRGMLDEDELDLLAAGGIDATIRDSNVVEMYSGYRDDFRIAANFSKQRDIAWGVRKDAPALRNALNDYLQLEHSFHDPNAIHTDDFDAIKQRKVLRVLLRNNASSYFLYKGELMGFEYEMARAFAKEHGLRLEVVVPPSHRELLTWLVEGRADLGIGFLNPTASRKALGITFSMPYNQEYQHVVVAKDDPIDSIDGIDARSFHVRRTSAYWEALDRLKQQGHRFSLQAAAENLETEQLIKAVGSGEIDATLADAHILDIELAKGTPVKSAFTIGEERPQAVAIRRQNPQLVDAINDFIRKTVKTEFYNVLYTKYFKSRTSIKRLARGRIESLEDDRLSPWDKLTQKHAETYGFDWRLITAQMYQESRFNPEAESFAGARGLMQLMPRTAKSVGIQDIDDPDSNIKAGVRYLDWLRDRFKEEMPLSEKTWFILASYNAGHGHVSDAQRLARQKGWDHNRWFNHTEKAMLLLSQKNYYQKARYGYVDGNEPVNYVWNIRNRFEAYTTLTRETVARVD
ncbi:MAG: transporter substrate-binding domain-containing protein [Gammaproteobacteria bacterium]|nr:transporter substrate-binding domain-containing protein [Gammaproteobacteria bacterium]